MFPLSESNLTAKKNIDCEKKIWLRKNDHRTQPTRNTYSPTKLKSITVVFTWLMLIFDQIKVFSLTHQFLIIFGPEIMKRFMVFSFLFENHYYDFDILILRNPRFWSD